jgi:hypothetical protein
MEINKDKIILGIVGGVVAGFMFGIGYILAERVMSKKKSVETAPLVDASASITDGTDVNFSGGYKPERQMQMPQQRPPQQRPRMSHSDPRDMNTSHNYMQFEGEMPKRRSSFAGMDFTTGVGANW